MSMSNDCENDVLAKIFNDTDFSWDAVTDLYLALHTADPGETGDQTTSEADYTGYARTAIVRAAGGWTVSGNQASNAALVQAPKCTGGSNTITHFSIGTAASGAGRRLISGALASPLAVSNNIQPQFAAGDLVVTAD